MSIFKKIKYTFLSLLFGIAFLTSCEEGNMPKPEQLVKENKMIDMLVDVHLAEATYDHFRKDTCMSYISSTNNYYSVLDKYNVPDSVFEQSLVYYASTPKKFEKMYREVMAILSEKEQKYSGRKEKLQIEDDGMKATDK
jgi:hypothetical protein